MNSEDEQHLKLLSIFHYVVGGMTALIACFPLIHFVVGIAIVSGNFGGPEMPSEGAFVGWFFIILAGTMITLGWGTALCMIITARKLKTRTGHTFCLVIAAIECLCFPFGTILGIFTIIVLTKESVKAQFDENSSYLLSQFD